jgi:hypothetical protein
LPTTVNEIKPDSVQIVPVILKKQEHFQEAFTVTLKQLSYAPVEGLVQDQEHTASIISKRWHLKTGGHAERRQLFSLERVFFLSFSI